MDSQSLSARVTRKLGRWLSRWQVDAEQYHWLLQASLRMDFRSKSAIHAGQQTSSTKSFLLQTSVVNAVFSLVIAVSLRATGVGTFFFSAVTLGYAMTMLAMSILIEFGLAVISPDDFLILAHRPISSRTFFAVKCSNLLFYVLWIDVSLTALPAVVGWTFPDAPWPFPLVYFVVAGLIGLFVAAAVAALYGLLLQRVNYERFKDILAWCQVLFSFLFFFGYQLIPRFMGRIHAFRIEEVPLPLALLLPPVWFASLLQTGIGHFSGFGLLLSGLAAVATGVLLPRLLGSVSLDYSDRIGQMISAAAPKETRPARPTHDPGLTWWRRLLLPDPEERAMFNFLTTMFRRNRQLKMRVYPTFGMVLALFALSLLDKERLADPLTGGQMGYGTLLPVMTFMLAAMGWTAAMPYCDEYQGAWIFHVAPLARPERFMKAAKKAVIILLFIPLFVLNATLFSFFWPMDHALIVSAYGMALGLVALQVMLFGFRDFPLSRKVEKGAQSRRFVMVFVMMAFFMFFTALASQLGASRWLAAAVGVALLGTGLVLGYFNNRAYARAIRQLEYTSE
jgi:ABC-2 type transport system permease protein